MFLCQCLYFEAHAAPSSPTLPRLGAPVRARFLPRVFAAVALNSLIEQPLESFSGLGIFVLGVPVYFYWSRRHRSSSFKPTAVTGNSPR